MYSLIPVSISVLIIFCSNILYSQVPTITSFTPTTGPVGTTVTITGTNFNTTAANNIVWFGATKAVVTTAVTISVANGRLYNVALGSSPMVVIPANLFITNVTTKLRIWFDGIVMSNNKFYTKSELQNIL